MSSLLNKQPCARSLTQGLQGRCDTVAIPVTTHPAPSRAGDGKGAARTLKLAHAGDEVKRMREMLEGMSEVWRKRARTTWRDAESEPDPVKKRCLQMLAAGKSHFAGELDRVLGVYLGLQPFEQDFESPRRSWFKDALLRFFPKRFFSGGLKKLMPGPCEAEGDPAAGFAVGPGDCANDEPCIADDEEVPDGLIWGVFSKDRPVSGLYGAEQVADEVHVAVHEPRVNGGIVGINEKAPQMPEKSISKKDAQ